MYINYKLKSLSTKLLQGLEGMKFNYNLVDKWYDCDIQKIATKITIINGKPYFQAPTLKHDRYSDVCFLIKEVCEVYKIPNCKFIVILNDSYGSQFPVFSIIRPQLKNIFNIPMPMGNKRGIDTDCATPIEGWDQYIQKTIKHEIGWDQKINKAVFRGKISQQTWANGQYGKKRADHWTHITRGKLYQCSRNEMFDVGFTKIEGVSVEQDLQVVNSIKFPDQQKYKYIISVGNNADWAERLRTHLFTNSVLIKHKAESFEWFYPLMKPWKHYIPCSIDFQDLEQNVMWAMHNQQSCKKIIARANKFAKKYINEKSMMKIMYYLIINYNKYFI
jgi:hypothetical protein